MGITKNIEVFVRRPNKQRGLPTRDQRTEFKQREGFSYRSVASYSERSPLFTANHSCFPKTNKQIANPRNIIEKQVVVLVNVGDEGSAEENRIA